MDKLIVATQMPDPFHAPFSDALGDTIFVRIPAGMPTVPDDIEVLITVPFGADGRVNGTRPEGWPFDLKWVQLPTVGLDFYPPWYFEVENVTIGRGRADIALAEFALAALFAAAKRIPDIWISEPGQWTRSESTNLAGTTLGIVGLGAVGERLAQSAAALGMKVCAIRHSDRPMPAFIERAPSLEQLFAKSDHVVLAAPSTPLTRHMVNADVLAQAKPGLHLVNIARGSLVDEDALLAALESGRVGLASLDVTAIEPPPADHPFYSHPRVRLSPHIASSTDDNILGLVERFAENLGRYRRGEPLLDQAIVTGSTQQ